MVSLSTQRAAENIQDTLEDRDLRGIGLFVGAGAVGAIIAREVAERVLSAVGMNRDPQSASEFGVSVLSQVGVALTLGIVGANMGGIALLLAAFAGAGALVSAGVDAFQVLQRGGIPGMNPQSQQSRVARGTGNASSPRRPSRSRATSTTTTRSSATGGSAWDPYAAGA